MSFSMDAKPGDSVNEPGNANIKEIFGENFPNRFAFQNVSLNNFATGEQLHEALAEQIEATPRL